MDIKDISLSKGGEKIKKVYLSYIDGDNKSCDCCDKEKKLATIIPLCGDAMCICKDCLKLMIEEF